MASLPYLPTYITYTCMHAPTILTMIDILSPSHHGKGIMTAVIHALIHDFAVPYMNARTIKATTYVENKGSARVFEKNGFKRQCTLEDWADVPQNRGGGKRSIHVYVWNRDEE